MASSARAGWSVVVVFIVMASAGCDRLLQLREDLKLTSARTSLGIGESVLVTVHKRRSWLRTVPLMDPSKTVYATTSESALVVEPDGWVTCVGTYGRPRESAWISAWNGKDYGHLSFDLRADGPGPTLELVAPSIRESPLTRAAGQSAVAPCCSPPLSLTEGQRIQFRIEDRQSRRDVTASTTGTRYTVFVGSGIPNDPRPSIITGGPNAVSAKSVILDDKEGTITAPESLDRLTHAQVIVVFRNGEHVGWQPIVVIHK